MTNIGYNNLKSPTVDFVTTALQADRAFINLLIALYKQVLARLVRTTNATLHQTLLLSSFLTLLLQLVQT